MTNTEKNLIELVNDILLGASPRGILDVSFPRRRESRLKLPF